MISGDLRVSLLDGVRHIKAYLLAGNSYVVMDFITLTLMILT